MDIILATATTAHWGLAGDYNEAHQSVQLRFDSGLIAGAYHNSEDAVFIEGGGDDLTVGAVIGVEYSIRIN